MVDMPEELSLISGIASRIVASLGFIGVVGRHFLAELLKDRLVNGDLGELVLAF